MTVSTQARTPFKIAVLPGDGIGPEVIAEALKVLKYLSERFQIPLHLEMAPIGGAALEASGEPLPKATLDLCQSADAVLMGSVGNPKYDTLPPEKRPEQGLLGLRKNLGLFANLRPVTLFKPLTFASTLKPEVLEGVDVLVVRELTGGIYFGRPRERDNQKALDTMTYTREEIERIVRLVFELAQTRRKHLTSVDKANVLACSQLWRSVVDALAPEYPDVTCEHMYVDNAAMQLILNPRQFDVLLTENMFGDILSDEASMLTGSLGMLASASLSGYGSSAKIDQKQPALYEPSHGSAPDIAGQQKANPLATILSVQMMLEYSLNCPEVAALIPQAVEQVLQMGIRTADIAEPGSTIVTTAQMGDKVLEVLASLPDPQPCTEKAQAVCVS